MRPQELGSKTSSCSSRFSTLISIKIITTLISIKKTRRSTFNQDTHEKWFSTSVGILELPSFELSHRKWFDSSPWPSIYTSSTFLKETLKQELEEQDLLGLFLIRNRRFWIPVIRFEHTKFRRGRDKIDERNRKKPTPWVSWKRRRLGSFCETR